MTSFGLGFVAGAAFVVLVHAVVALRSRRGGRGADIINIEHARWRALGGRDDVRN